MTRPKRVGEVLGVKERKMSFVDTRLHVAVRPTLEYLLPEVGRTMKRCLLGDVSTKEALPMLECCVFPEEAHERPNEEEPDEAFASLRRSMSDTLSHTHDYLSHVSSVWKEALTTIRSHTSRITDTFEEERRTAVRVRDRYRSQNPDVVDREFAAEIDRIRASLNESLQRIRDEEEPCPCRPDDFVESCHSLRDTFAHSYGSCSTKHLLRLKDEFEAELVRLQRGISDDFVVFCTRLLR